MKLLTPVEDGGVQIREGRGASSSSSGKNSASGAARRTAFRAIGRSSGGVTERLAKKTLPPGTATAFWKGSVDRDLAAAAQEAEETKATEKGDGRLGDKNGIELERSAEVALGIFCGIICV